MKTLVIFTRQYGHMFEAFEGETLEDLRDQIMLFTEHTFDPAESISENELAELAAHVFDVDQNSVIFE